MSIMQFLPRMHTKGFPSPPPPPPPPPHWFSTDGSPQTNLTENPCFILLGSDLPTAEFRLWLTAHWLPDLSTPNFTESSQFQVD